MIFLVCCIPFLILIDARIQKSMVKSITPTWFSSLSSKKQLQIFSVLVKKRSTTAAGATRKTLSNLSIDSTILVFLLDEHRKSLAELESSKGSHSHGKRHKIDPAAATIASDRVASIDSLVSLLELSSSGAVGISERHLLVPVLFDLLGSVVGLPHGQQFSVGVEYCKQLLLSFLLSLLKSCIESSIVLDESLLHVDYIVQCIRGTDNPQTHNASLILMAAIAGMHPDSVLANIMPVFTFMGANVLRQDDNYSFHVIKQVSTRLF
jgi:U3 small nucleolar RNA-associated protein 10